MMADPIHKKKLVDHFCNFKNSYRHFNF